MTRVLLVHGPRHGETIDDPAPSMIHERGHDPRVGSACEGYGPIDHYGFPDALGVWPTHHRDTITAKVPVAFSHDSLCLSTLEALAIGKTTDALAASFDGVEDAWVIYCSRELTKRTIPA